MMLLVVTSWYFPKQFCFIFICGNSWIFVTQRTVKRINCYAVLGLCVKLPFTCEHTQGMRVRCTERNRIECVCIICMVSEIWIARKTCISLCDTYAAMDAPRMGTQITTVYLNWMVCASISNTLKQWSITAVLP